MFRHDSSHTGSSASHGPITNYTLWAFPILPTGRADHSPAVIDDRLYIGCNFGAGPYMSAFYCLNAMTGAQIWEFPTNAWLMRGSPAVADGRVYFGTSNGELYCLNAMTGVQLWERTFGDGLAAPAVVGSRVYVTDNDGWVHCLASSTGATLWDYNVGRPTQGAPTVSEGRVYLGAFDKNVYCFDALAGGKLWNRTLPSSDPDACNVASSPAVVDGKVYIGAFRTAEDNFYCLDAENGSVIWSHFLNDPVHASPAVADGRVYITDEMFGFYCFDALDGHTLWSRFLSGPSYEDRYFHSSPAVAQDRIYLTTMRHIICCDASTGAIVWKYRADSTFSTPAVADGVVYIGARNNVYAFTAPLSLRPSLITPLPLESELFLGYVASEPLQPPEVAVRTFDGSEWGRMTVPIPDPPTAPFAPSVTVNPEPVLYEPLLTMATTVNPEPVLNNPNIALRQYNGSTWSGPAVVPNTAYSANPAIQALPSTDDLFLFWEFTNRTPTHGIALSIYNQTHWSTYGNFLGDGENPTATYYNDEIYVLWEKDNGLAYRAFNPANDSWSEERGQQSPFLINPQPSPYDPQITVHDGLLYLTYESLPTNRLYLHSFNGSAWSAAFPVENVGDLQPSHPAIASFDTHLYIAYAAGDAIYYQTLTGSLTSGVWSLPEQARIGDDWWPMFRHDNPHSGFSTSTAPHTNSTAWNYTTLDDVFSSPAIVDNKVYIGSYDANVYCLNLSTGEKLWNYTTGDKIFSSPTIADDRLYVGSYDRNVYCLNASTGEFIWSHITFWIYSSPTVVDDRVYIGSGNQQLYCLNATTGADIWTYPTGSPIYSSPAVADGRVYIGSDDSQIYCLNATTGLKIWNYTTGGAVRSSPVIASGWIYAGSADKNVYCLNATTGTKLWNYTTGNRILYSSPAIVENKIYVGSEDQSIYCLDASTGTPIWSYVTGDAIWPSPAVAEGKVYIASHDRKVYCLNASTGSFIWSYRTGSYVLSSPAIAQNRVVIGSNDNKVYAFKTPTAIHDAAITDIAADKLACGQGYSVTVNVTCVNYHTFNENVSLEVYVEYNPIAELQTFLLAGAEQTFSFTWNTSEFTMGFYSIQARVWIEADDVNSTNNILAFSAILVTIPGDVDGDRDVDIFDIVAMATIYGVVEPDPEYAPNCDIDGDGDIDIFDIVLAASHYGESW
jgi:outer membrane protein assembly factor BamB